MENGKYRTKTDSEIYQTYLKSIIELFWKRRTFRISDTSREIPRRYKKKQRQTQNLKELEGDLGSGGWT